MDIMEEIRNLLSRHQSNPSTPNNDLPTLLQIPQAVSRPTTILSTTSSGHMVSSGFQSRPTGNNAAVDGPNFSVSSTLETPRRYPTQSQVTEQLRSNFQPYDLADRRRSCPSTVTSGSYAVNQMRANENQRICMPGSSRARAPRPFSRAVPKWTAALIFLGAPDELTCPTADRHRQLTDARLGKTHVTCDLDASAAALKAAIMDVFNRESSTNYQEQFSNPNFNFSLASLRGSGSRDLSFFRSDASPRELKSLGVKTLYAKPSLVLVCLDSDEDTAEENRSNAVIVETVPAPNNSLFENFTMPPRTEQQVTIEGTGGFMLDMSGYPDLESLRRLLAVLHPGYQTIDVPQLGSQLLPLTLLSTIGCLNVDQSIRVAIESERTVDAGGPRRSFVWKMMCAIRDGMYNGVHILEGSGKALTISNDRCLQRENVMYNLGRFFALAIGNIGFGFFGLNKLLVKMICDTWSPTAEDISLEDIPYEDSKTVASILLAGVHGGIPSWTVDDRRQVRSYLHEKNWRFEVTAANVKEAFDFVKLESVCESRQQSILEVRRGLQNTDIGRWVKCHPEQHNVLFPEDLPMDVTFDELEASMDGLEDYGNLQAMFRAYFESFSSSERKISKFIEAVTGLPYLGERRINIFVLREPRLFTCSTCSYEFRMFETATQEIFATNMDIFLANCGAGFTRG